MVYTGIPISVILDPKHRLWVLVRTASAASLRRFYRVRSINVLRKISQEIFIFYSGKILCILHRRVFVMKWAIIVGVTNSVNVTKQNFLLPFLN